jgi:phosphohistidine phosphatase
MKSLYLVRHAKSSWADPSLADKERPLNKRGLRDAPLMGQRLAARKVRVDAIWSSPAQRALETAHFFASALKYPRKSIELHDRFYTNTIDDLLREIRSCTDEIKSLVVVSHNPVISEFANFLIGHGKDVDIESIPTCGIVAIDFDLPSWQLLREQEGRFLFFDYPKKDVTPL